MGGRAEDPGTRYFQYRPGWGVADAMWIMCPRCDGPARKTTSRVVCIKCGYTDGEKRDHPRVGAKMTLKAGRPACRHCKAEIPGHGRLARDQPDGDPLMAEVRCPGCRKTALYPAYVSAPKFAHTNRAQIPKASAPYLRRPYGAHTLFVLNRAHLDALEEWLSADLRERGATAGLTMMARLPKWMKAASARADIVKLLADMRAQAEAEGLW